jgi:hypothetical protein
MIELRVKNWIQRLAYELECLELRASIEYNLAGKRFKVRRERFWNRFTEVASQGLIAQAWLVCEAFSASRRVIK